MPVTPATTTTPPSYSPVVQQPQLPWSNADSTDLVMQLAQMRDDNFTETDWVVTDWFYESGATWELWSHTRDGWAWWWSPTLGVWWRDRR